MNNAPHTTKKAAQLVPGDMADIFGDGRYTHIRQVHLPNTDWNPYRTVVRVAIGTYSHCGWISLRANRRYPVHPAQ